jgi:hypothetical protein
VPQREKNATASLEDTLIRSSCQAILFCAYDVLVFKKTSVFKKKNCLSLELHCDRLRFTA